MAIRPISWFVAGFLAAVALCVGADRAFAQTGTSSSASQSSTELYRYGDPLSDDGNPPPDDAEGTGQAPDRDGVIDGIKPVPRIGRRRIIDDGSPDSTPEPAPVKDGIVDMSEPEPVQDGLDMSKYDMRSQEDIAAFENPPAGHDPLLFQIEDLDPITDDRRVRRLFEADPYAPVGIRVGSFILFPEVELASAYTSNTFLSPDSQSDYNGIFLPSARLVSNWSNHALEFRAAGDLSEHARFESENNRGYNVEARGKLDIRRRTNVQALISRDESQESRSAIDASSVGTRSTVTVDRAEAALNHRFNRLSVQLRGSVSDFKYSDTETIGVINDNSDRNYLQTEQTVRATWEFKPTFSVFGEVAINQRDYDRPAQIDNINRSSTGERYRAGVSFGNTGEYLRGEIALGYGVQRPDASSLDTIDGLIIDANATWRVNALTSVLFTASSDVYETTTENVAGAISRSAGIEVRHELRRHLIGSAGINYAVQDSQDGVIFDRELRTRIGVEYFLNRNAVLFGDYTHTKFNAVGQDSDYRENEVRMGVRLRR